MPDKLRSNGGKDWENKPANNQLFWYTMLKFQLQDKWLQKALHMHAIKLLKYLLLEGSSTIKNNG